MARIIAAPRAKSEEMDFQEITLMWSERYETLILATAAININPCAQLRGFLVTRKNASEFIYVTVSGRVSVYKIMIRHAYDSLRRNILLETKLLN